MKKLQVLVSKEAPEWQKWAAINLCRCNENASVIESGYVSPTSRETNWQYTLERRKCNVEVDITSFNQYVVEECNLAEGDVAINLCGMPHEDIRKLYKKEVRIWDMMYHGTHLAKLSHIGEYEQQKHKSNVCVDLTEDEEYVLDTARYNVHYSAVRNYTTATYSVYHLINKAIKQQPKRKEIEQKEKYAYSSIAYLVGFYTRITKMAIGRVRNKLTGYYNEQWTVGLGRGRFLQQGIASLHQLPMPQGEFWADPFVYHHPESHKDYLFVERFPFSTKKGIIGCGEIDQGLNVKEMHTILERPYHLSYPHLIEEDGALYMMPECSANRQIEVYQCVNFPNQWELYSIGLKGENVADTVYFRDRQGDAWIFCTRCDTCVDLHCTALYIYKVDGLQFSQVTPHKMNPIILDSSFARNGGRIYCEDGHIYRVAQNNSHGMYGYGISIREITKLNLEEYEETETNVLIGKSIPGFNGTHQMCQTDDMFAIDLRR